MCLSGPTRVQSPAGQTRREPTSVHKGRLLLKVRSRRPTQPCFLSFTASGRRITEPSGPPDPPQRLLSCQRTPRSTVKSSYNNRNHTFPSHTHTHTPTDTQTHIHAHAHPKHKHINTQTCTQTNTQTRICTHTCT